MAEGILSTEETMEIIEEFEKLTLDHEVTFEQVRLEIFSATRFFCFFFIKTQFIRL